MRKLFAALLASVALGLAGAVADDKPEAPSPPRPSPRRPPRLPAVAVAAEAKPAEAAAAPKPLRRRCPTRATTPG
jgi:hypothetical protein